VIVRSRAPLRLGFAGGGSDVSPFCDRFGGYVLNATINLYAYCTIEQLEIDQIIFEAKDLNVEWSSSLTQHLQLEGDLLLHKAIYNYVIENYNNNQPLALKVVTFSDAPPGSGLGSSSTMVVTILRAYQELLRLPFGEYDLARIAYYIERVVCGLAGGKQDQFAATFGGFNFIEFYEENRVIVNPLRIRDDIINELEAHLMMYYTGQSRDSAKIINDQAKTAATDEEEFLDAMHKVKASAVDMKEALLRSDITRMAKILENSWLSKKRTSSSITNPHIEEVHQAALERGAYSAKLSGAGGGGFMMLFIDPVKRLAIEACLREFGGESYRFHFTQQGAQGWSA
jgi:D-glycero-alpha-D-manno-heptose-7-phosphate kinase